VATIFQHSTPHTVRLRRRTSDELLYGANSRRTAGTNDMLEALVELSGKHGLSQHLPEDPLFLLLTNKALMCINTHMDSRTVIKALEKNGWYKVDQSGSHIQFRHPSKKGRVTVPHPKKDIPVGTLKSIERQAGIKFE